MKGFLKFLLIWISQNLAIPFWVVGHIHLSIHNFHDAIEILSSIGVKHANPFFPFIFIAQDPHIPSRLNSFSISEIDWQYTTTFSMLYPSP